MTPRHHPVPERGRRQRWMLAATAALAITADACGNPTSGQPERATPPDGQQPTTTSAPPATTTTSVPGNSPAREVVVDDEAADPVRVEIPAIGVSAPVIALGLDTAGALEVPTDFARTGWWTGGPEPGERGPAVIAGHVDSTRGPAVFYRLPELQAGDIVTVHRADGTTVDFVVDRLARHPKTEFPTDAVYSPTTRPELRLITCGGTFDRTSGHYLDNHIVFAHRP